MLQDIRDRSQGWLTWVIVIVICVMFALWGINYYLSGSSGVQQVVAKVNGVEISSQALTTAYQRVATQQQGSSNDPTLRAQVLNALILQQVLTQAAQTAHFYVDDSEVDQTIVAMPAFQDNGQFSLQKFQAILQSLGMNPQQLRAEIAADMVLQQAETGISASDFVLPDEVRTLADQMNQTRSIGYFTIQTKQFVNQAHVSDAEIAQYYQAHQADYALPERVSLDYVLLSKADLAKQQTVSDAEVNAYYQQNQASLKRPLAAVKAQIISTLQQQKAETLYAQSGSQLSTLAFENPNSLSYVAQQLNLTVQRTQPLSRKGTKTGIGAYPQLIKAAFDDNVFKDGNNSDIINLSDSQAVVIRVHQIYPSVPRPLAEVRGEILMDLQTQQAQALAEAQAETVLKQLQAGVSPAAIARQNHLSWQTAPHLSHTDKSVDTNLIAAVYAAPLPETRHPVNQIVMLTNGDIAVFNLQTVDTPNTNSQDKSYAEYSKILQSMYAAMTYNNYSNAVKGRAKIQIIGQ